MRGYTGDFEDRGSKDCCYASHKILSSIFYPRFSVLGSRFSVLETGSPLSLDATYAVLEDAGEHIRGGRVGCAAPCEAEVPQRTRQRVERGRHRRRVELLVDL